MSEASEKLNSVLMFGSVDPDVCNACTLHLAGVANAFVDQAIEVRLLAPRSSPDSELRKALDPRVKLVEFAQPRIPLWPSVWSFGPLCALRLFTDTIKSKAPDLVYVRTGMLTWLLHVIARRAGIFTMAEHNGLFRDELHGFPGSFIRWPSVVCQSVEGRIADCSLAVTGGLARQLADIGVPAKRIVVIGNGTDVERLNVMRREDALAALGLPSGLTYVGFLGTLQPWQGVSTLLQALAIARRSDPSLSLIIGGEGPQTGSLKHEAAGLGLDGVVHFLGHVGMDRRDAVFSAMDIAVMPATAARNAAQGASPLKVRDYAASGRAIVASRLPGLEDIERAEAGVLFTPDSADELALRILELSRDPERRQRLGAASRDFARAHYSWRAVTEQIVAAVQAIKRLRNRPVGALTSSPSNAGT